MEEGEEEGRRDREVERRERERRRSSSVYIVGVKSKLSTQEQNCPTVSSDILDLEVEERGDHALTLSTCRQWGKSACVPPLPLTVCCMSW